MGNNCCRTFCFSENEIVMDMALLTEMVHDVSHLHHLISIIEERLKSISTQNEKGQQNTPPQNIGGSSWFASCTNFGKDLVEVSKRAERNRCMVCCKSRETRRVAIQVLKEASQIHPLAAGLCIVGYLLDQIDQLSTNKDQCLQLMKYMCAMARRVKQLDDRLPAQKEELSQAVHMIFEGCLLCLTQMKSHKLSRIFYASVDAGDLQNLESQIRNTYPDLILGALMGVLDNMPRVLPPTQGPQNPSAVGIEDAKDRVSRLLKMGPIDESRRAVVVYGVGGVGKTTLATAVFKSLDLEAYKFCRVDMDQNCSVDHIKQLQQQILQDLFGKKNVLMSYSQGQDQLTQAFRESNHPIFLFIDNALVQNDLAKLLPEDLSCLPRGMRMLITTRRLDQTNILLKTDFERCEFRVDSLSHSDSTKLLCKIVLGSASASFPKGIESIDVGEIVEMCGGIPLVIELVGPKLKRGVNDASAVKSLKEFLKESLMEGEGEMSERVVDVVYNTLDDLCKEAFLDVVCFFNKRTRRMVTHAVGKVQLEALEDAALVKLSVNEDLVIPNIVDMSEFAEFAGKTAQVVNVHDIISARGRKLSQSNRILDLESLMEAVKDTQKLQKIKGISISSSAVNDGYKIQAEHLDMMHTSLRVLKLPESIKVNGICLRSFESLKYVDISGPLPIDLKKLKRLAVLFGTVCNNVGELPASLHALRLNNSPNLPTLLQSFANLSSLEYMNLEGCDVLLSVPTSVCQLKSLTLLDLRKCSNVTTLPETFGNLSALTILVLSKCSQLTNLPPSFGQLKSLVFLNMEGCKAITSLPDSFSNLSSLRVLLLSECERLTVLPESFGNLSALTSLDLSRCSNLLSLPESFAQLNHLKLLHMASCERLTSLADNFGKLASLKFLTINRCNNLKTLNNDFGSLTSLLALGASNCQSLQGEAMDILVKMESLMFIKIDGSERMMARWKDAGQHYPLMVYLDDEIDTLLHIVEHTLFHSRSRFVGVDGNGKLAEWSWSCFLGEDAVEGEEEIEVVVLLTMCDLLLDSNKHSLEQVKKELERRIKERCGSGNFQIVYAEAGDSFEKSEEHIHQTLLVLLKSCPCAFIVPDNKTSTLFNYALYRVHKSGSNGMMESIHTCIVGLRVVMQREKKWVKSITGCFPGNYKDDSQAMLDLGGGLKTLFSPLEKMVRSMVLI